MPWLYLDPLAKSLERRELRAGKSPNEHNCHRNSGQEAHPSWLPEMFVLVLEDSVSSIERYSSYIAATPKSTERRSTREMQLTHQEWECTHDPRHCKRDLQKTRQIRLIATQASTHSSNVLVSIHSWNRLLARNVARTATAFGKLALQAGM